MRPFLPNCSEKRGPSTFLSLRPKFYKIVKRAMMFRLPTAVTFAAPSNRVGGGPGGNSRHRGAAVWPVPWGSTHLKSGPAPPPLSLLLLHPSTPISSSSSSSDQGRAVRCPLLLNFLPQAEHPYGLSPQRHICPNAIVQIKTPKVNEVISRPIRR